MRFDTPADDGPEVITGRKGVADIARALRTDGRLDAAERCVVAEALADRFFGEGSSVAERLNCDDA